MQSAAPDQILGLHYNAFATASVVSRVISPPLSRAIS
jgi:hypothetical protein